MAGDVRGSDWRPLNCRQVTASIPHESSASDRTGPFRDHGYRGMTIDSITLFKVAVPLRRVVKHASFERSVSENLVVRVTLAGGVVGYGEGVPRRTSPVRPWRRPSRPWERTIGRGWSAGRPIFSASFNEWSR